MDSDKNYAENKITDVKIINIKHFDFKLEMVELLLSFQFVIDLFVYILVFNIIIVVCFYSLNFYDYPCNVNKKSTSVSEHLQKVVSRDTFYQHQRKLY